MPTGFADAVLPSSSLDSGRAAARVSPPRKFRAAGGVRSAWLCEGPFAGRTPLRGSAAQKAGVRYERRIHDLLAQCFQQEGFAKGQWFQFLDEGNNRRYCQVDGLTTKGPLILFEVKIRFTSDAYFQLHQLYKPVVEKAFGRPVDALVQVCRYYDPASPFPEPVRLLEEINTEAILAGDRKLVGVYTWRV